MTKSKREELGQIVIRPPEGMRERIKAAAEANNRSMNAEIVATLEEKYPAPTLPGRLLKMLARAQVLHRKIQVEEDLLTVTNLTAEYENLMEEISNSINELKSRAEFLISTNGSK